MNIKLTRQRDSSIWQNKREGPAHN